MAIAAHGRMQRSTLFPQKKSKPIYVVYRLMFFFSWLLNLLSKITKRKDSGGGLSVHSQILFFMT